MKKLMLFAILLITTSVFGQASAGFTKIGNTANVTYTDATCPNSSSCYYQVTSLDSTGHESQPAMCAASQLCFATNQAVAQMPSSGTHTVVLSWTAPTGVSGVTFNVYQHIGPPSPTLVMATVN